MRCCWKCRWSRSIFPTAIRARTLCARSPGEDDNIKRLSWAMGRFTGYVGVTNLLGGRFLANSDALSPVMTFLKRRGLMFFDSGSATRSAAPDVARATGTLFAESAVTIDTIQTGMEIDRRLSELEARARASGRAAGSGFIYPVTIERIASWAKGLPGRGFVLVPVSAIVPPARRMKRLHAASLRFVPKICPIVPAWA